MRLLTLSLSQNARADYAPNKNVEHRTRKSIAFRCCTPAIFYVFSLLFATVRVAVLACANSRSAFPFFLTAALKDYPVSFTKHDAPFRTTEKCGARWPPHTTILNDITGTETRQTWKRWLGPSLFANGKLPYCCIDFYTANLFVALSDTGVCAYCLCCQVFGNLEASTTSHPPYLLL